MISMVPIAKLERGFYQRDAITVARELLGCILVHRVGRKVLRARIVETEAYVGQHDLACHATKGRTQRNAIMFGPGGYAYVYFIYGMYDMLNAVTGLEGDAQAVLIRAAEPQDGWQASLTGPGKLTRAMHITRKDNAADLYGDKLYIEPAIVRPQQILATPRIGVDYAGAWKDQPLRFVDAGSKALSRKIRGYPA